MASVKKITSAQELIAHLGAVYQSEMQKVLLSLYHKLAQDQLTLSDLEDLGVKYNIDLESEYLDRFLEEKEECGDE